MLAKLSRKVYSAYNSLLPKSQTSIHRSHIHTEVMRCWLESDMAKVSGNVGLDIGAGGLANRPLFKTRHYIAVEPLERSAETGRARYPNAEIHVCRIEDYEANQPIDLAVACTVFGNKYFEFSQVMPTIQRVTQWLAPGGVFLFDIGPRAISHEPQIDNFLPTAFERVEKRVYGRFDWTAPPFVTAPVGRMLSQRVELNVPKDPSRRRLYYACSGKR